MYCNIHLPTIIKVSNILHIILRTYSIERKHQLKKVWRYPNIILATNIWSYNIMILITTFAAFHFTIYCTHINWFWYTRARVNLDPKLCNIKNPLQCLFEMLPRFVFSSLLLQWLPSLLLMKEKAWLIFLTLNSIALWSYNKNAFVKGRNNLW